MVVRLSGRYFNENGRQDDYAYFATELARSDKLYRLVWLFKDDALYLGVVNCFRRD
ncbi:MAG: hypothetical protein IT285_12465 [Bdellovibrionales bacterium]|nr:hypothetical protein [Bdellovibrionales bacterium]